MVYSKPDSSAIKWQELPSTYVCRTALMRCKIHVNFAVKIPKRHFFTKKIFSVFLYGCKILHASFFYHQIYISLRFRARNRWKSRLFRSKKNKGSYHLTVTSYQKIYCDFFKYFSRILHKISLRKFLLRSKVQKFVN